MVFGSLFGRVKNYENIPRFHVIFHKTSEIFTFKRTTQEGHNLKIKGGLVGVNEVHSSTEPGAQPFVIQYAKQLIIVTTPSTLQAPHIHIKTNITVVTRYFNISFCMLFWPLVKKVILYVQVRTIHFSQDNFVVIVKITSLNQRIKKTEILTLYFLF